jgi:hypothetical protein
MVEHIVDLVNRDGGGRGLYKHCSMEQWLNMLTMPCSPKSPAPHRGGNGPWP